MNNPDRYYLSENEVPFEEFLQFGLSIDCVLFGYENSKLRVLLIQRGAEPFQGDWAIPGDLVNPEEDLPTGATRILRHLTGLNTVNFEQFHTFGAVDRHPVGRVVTVGYYSLVHSNKHNPIASSWASNVKWFDIKNLPKLAFDHNEILNRAFAALQKKIRTEPVGFNLLPPKFTLLELQGVYEALLDQRFDKPNFRKKILSTNLLVELTETQRNVSHRPAKLFQFDMNRYETLKTKNFSFEL